MEKFGRDLDQRSGKQTSALIDKVVRQYDPAHPASPMSQQASLTATLESNRKAMEAKVDSCLRRSRWPSPPRPSPA